MKKILPILLVLVFNSLFVLSQTPQPTSTPDDGSDEIKVSTTLIQIDVVVTDKNNKRVTNLKLDDFEVFENGKKLDISNFSYVSPKTTNESNKSSTSDSLNLQADEDGLSLKDKISIPTREEPTDSQNFRRTFVLVVDTLGLNFDSIQLVKKSVKNFIDDQIKPGDLVTIVTTAGSRVLPAFTSDKKQLHATLKKLKWSPQSRGGVDGFEPIRNTMLEDLSESRGIDVPGTNEEVALLEDIDRNSKNNSAVGTIGSLNFIVSGMRYLNGRKALVLFSEGFSLSEVSSQKSSGNLGEITSTLITTTPSISNRFGSGVGAAMELLIKTANQASVVIYAIDPRGLQNLGMANANDDVKRAFGRNFRPGDTNDKRTAREDYFQQTQDSLRVLADETGGFAILNQNDIDKGLEKIIDDQSYYLLGYLTDLETIDSSSDAVDKIEIRVKDPDMRVRYRSAFYAANSRNSEINSALTPREKMGQALAYPFRANEIKLNLYSITGNDRYGEFIRFLVNISADDLNFERDSKNERKANFDMLAITLDVDGKPINQFSQNFSITVNEPTYKNILKRGIVYVLPVLLKKSGVYHFRVAVRDSKSGKVGAAAKFLETPKFEKKRLWISNLTLQSDSKDNSRNSEKNDTGLYTDTTLREFDAPVTLKYGAVIYNAKTDQEGAPDLSFQTRLILNDEIIEESAPEQVSMDDQEDKRRIGLFGKFKIKKDLKPGNYIFQIIVIDNLAKKQIQTATQWIDFELAGK